MKTQRKRPNEEHPFYCTAKRCRKTAWDTPEYLTARDRERLPLYVAALRAKDQVAFDALFARANREDSDAWFNRFLGWPEGKGYYVGGSEMYRANCFAGWILRDLPELEKVLDSF